MNNMNMNNGTQSVPSDMHNMNNNTNKINNIQSNINNAPPIYSAPMPPYADFGAYYPPAPTVKKRKIAVSKRDFVFALLFFGTAIVITDFVLWHGLSLGFSLAFLLLFAVVTAYYADKGKRPPAFAVSCGALSLASAGLFAVSNDEFLKLFMLIPTALLFALYVCGISGGLRRRCGSAKILGDAAKSVFKTPAENIGAVVGGYCGFSLKNKANKNVVIGILMALPVLAAVIPLLASSDAAFENLVKTAFKNIGTGIGKTIIAAVIAFLLIVYAVSNKYSAKAAKAPSVSRRLNPAVSVSFLSVISCVYLVFLFSQLAYFFSAFSGVLPQGYTYSASEFARRGFYEMAAVCIINTALLSAVAVLTKKSPQKVLRAVKALSLFIMLFSALLLAISAAKMGLNISIFGLTKNRLFVCLLMAAFGVVLIFFAIHLLAPKVPYMQPVIIICSAIFIAFAYFNSDNAIVKYNIAKYESGAISSIDGYYLSSLKGALVSDFAEIEKSGNNSAVNGARSAIIGRICECCPEFFGGGFAVNNDIEYKKSDFREYNLLGDQVKKDAVVYYNSLSEKERRTLYSQYLLEERGGTYDPDSNSYTVWENDGNEAVYSYDSATGEYIKSQSVHAAVYESNGYDDDNYGNERENESGSYLYVSKIK